MKKILLFIIAIFLFNFSFAQPDPSIQLGLEFDAQKFGSMQKLPTDFGSGSKGDELPFHASLKDYMPPIANQGPCATCVGWSVGHYTMTMAVGKANNWSPEKIVQDAFSSLFVYNQIKRSNCLQGVSIYDAADFLCKRGNVKSSDFDDPACECTRTPSPELSLKAQDQKLESFYALFNSDADANTKVFKTKKALSMGVPVAAGIMVRRNIAKPSGTFWDPNEGDASPWGGHAMAVVGYDDRKGAFEIANSWGPKWGNDGFIWVKYDDFAEHCVESYVFVVREEEETESDDVVIIKKDKIEKDKDESHKPVTLKGRFDFRVPFFTEQEELDFEYSDPIHASGYFYELKKKDWYVGDQYQLVVSGMQKGRYIYVFSVDNKGYNIHWPRKAEFSTKFFGADEAPIIPWSKVKITIPSEDRIFTPRVKGVDQICILYSDKEISDFKTRVESVNDSSGEFRDRFNKGFGDLIIPEVDINYNEDKMSFYASSTSGKSIVPIVLTFNVK